MARTSIGQVAYVLALIGGILLVIFGLLSLLSIGFGGPAFFYWSVYSFAYSGIVMLICGVIAIVGARSVTTLVWAIIIEFCNKPRTKEELIEVFVKKRS
jgi:hypothetical protein